MFRPLRASRTRSFALACATCAVFTTAANRADALDHFEVQVYDGSANQPGELTLENHVNFVADGLHMGVGPELPTNHQAHWTFEGGLGVTPYWEPGVYLQTALLPGGEYDYAGVKLRSKFIVPQLLYGFLRLGMNFEVSAMPASFDATRYSIELRPIVSAQWQYFRLAFNPIVGVALTEPALRQGPGFEPALLVRARATDELWLGLEYYGDLGPLAHVDPLARQQHYVYAATDCVLAPGWDLNLGAGWGLTPASDGFVVKAILGISLAQLW
jgi:hypothetical protein